MNVAAAVHVVLNPFQEEVVGCPFNLFLGGGNGGSKTWAGYFKVLDHAQRHGSIANILWLRVHAKPAGDAFTEFQEFCFKAGVEVAEPNKNNMQCVVNGCTITFGYCSTIQEYRASWSGKSYSLIVIDELQGWDALDVPDQFMSRLRSANVACQVLIIANPGGVIYPQVVARFINPSRSLKRGTPFRIPELGNMVFVSLPSCIDDNPALDRTAYERALRAAARGSEALYKQARFGDFDSVAGQFFPMRACNYLDVPARPTFGEGWKFRAACDHGSRAIYEYLCAAQALDDSIGPDGEYFPRHSLVIVGEATSADPSTGFSKPMHDSTVYSICSDIHRLHERLNLRVPTCAIDNQAFQRHGSRDINLAGEYTSYGVHVVPAKKGERVTSLQKLRELILGAAPAGQRKLPGLYLHATAVPYLRLALESTVASEKYPEDTADGPMQHAIDAARYLVNSYGVNNQGEWSTLPVVHGQGAERELLEFIERRKQFGSHPISIGPNHPLAKSFPIQRT